MNGYIYRITNKINGKKYIGQTARTIQERWNEHIAYSKNECRQEYYGALAAALRKYGVENFTLEEICEADISQLDELEIKYIAEEHTLVGEHGYNLTPGGQSSRVASVDESEICALFEKTHNATYIARTLNLGTTLVKSIIKRNGYELLSSADYVEKYISDTIYQYDIETGELLNVFQSSTKAGKWIRENGFSKATTDLSAAGAIHKNPLSQRPIVHGYYWCYEELEPDIVLEKVKTFYAEKVKPKKKPRRKRIKCSCCGKEALSFNELCEDCQKKPREERSNIIFLRQHNLTRDELKAMVRTMRPKELADEFGVTCAILTHRLKHLGLGLTQKQIHLLTDEEWEKEIWNEPGFEFPEERKITSDEILQCYIELQDTEEVAKQLNIGLHRILPIVSQYEALKKGYICGKRRGLAVTAYDRSTDENLATYTSALAAARAYQGKDNGTNIINCCRGKRETCYGVGWHFATEEEKQNIDIVAEKQLINVPRISVERSLKTKVAQLDKKTGEIINIYESYSEAARQNVPTRTVRKVSAEIGKVCRGLRKSAYGYRWCKVDDDGNLIPPPSK